MSSKSQTNETKQSERDSGTARSNTVGSPALHDSVGNHRISRRSLMRAAAVGGTAAVGASHPAVNFVGDSEAVAPAVAVGISVAGGIALGYATRYVQDKLTGPDIDTERYSDLAADTFHAQAIEDGAELNYYNDQVTTNLLNVLDLSGNGAMSDARMAAIEQWNLENGELAGIDAGHAAIDDFFATQEENILEHLTFQADKFDQMVTDAQNYTKPIFTLHDANGKTGHASFWSDWGTLELSRNLSDGTSYTYRVFQVRYDDGGGTSNVYFDIVDDETTLTNGYIKIGVEPVDTGGDTILYNHLQFNDVWTEIQNQYSQVTSDFDSWASNIYTSYTAGDIDLSDMVSASDLADSAPEESGYSFEAAQAAMLGISGADHTMQITLHDDQTMVTGTIYIRNQDGKVLDTGITYDPADFAGPVWIAYEYDAEVDDTDGVNATNTSEDDDGDGYVTLSEFAELEQQFTIESAVDIDGNEVDTVTLESRNQQTTTTDISELESELDRIRQLQNELEAERNNAATGGGGGFSLDAFSIGSIPGGATLLVVGGTILALLGNNSS